MKRSILKTGPACKASILKTMISGAAIALAIIMLFLFSDNKPHPEWGKFWMVKPLLIAPIGGAIGGACSYIAYHLFRLSGCSKFFAVTVCIIGYVLALWISFVLGLNGAYWD